MSAESAQAALDFDRIDVNNSALGERIRLEIS
jgi:hypothetical protein